MKSKKFVLLVTVGALLAGCQKPAEPPPLKPAPKKEAPPLAPPSGSAAESAAPAAPPPTTPVADTTAPATPPPPGGAAESAAPTASPGTDPLYYFRRDANGKVLSDMEALQEAATAYGRKAGMSDEAGKDPWPNLTDLSLLVKVGMLKALPAAPEGKKYTVDFRTQKVSLVNK